MAVLPDDPAASATQVDENASSTTNYDSVVDNSKPNITCMGGGHGLFATLRAARTLSDNVQAIVTVADDGGSSGRLRREIGGIPPGDLRMAIAALAADDADGRLWEELLQHRFSGSGALRGHAVGNLLITGLAEVMGDDVAALDRICELLRVRGNVLPVSPIPLDLEAEVSGLDDDPRVLTAIRGQVAVASTPGQVRRVRLQPENPPATPRACEALMNADLITLGPGSWFSSVIPHLLVPEIVESANASSAPVTVVLNLVAEASETAGFSGERHLHMLAAHCPDLKIDAVIIDQQTVGVGRDRTAVTHCVENMGATPIFADVRHGDHPRLGSTHAPHKLAAALQQLLPGR